MHDASIPSSAPKRIALCAGEASGDLLGADLIAALKRHYPAAEFAGIGGPAMQNQGLQSWFDAQELAVMGIAEVLAHLPRLFKIRKAFRQRVLDWRPDVFIGIDAPDFNLGVEKWLKGYGIRTVHYVSPSIWAWRQKRAETIGESADRVLCLFPMEPDIYARHGVDARFVGHPMADQMALEPNQTHARQQLDLPADATILAVLPGSRLSEVSRLGDVFLHAVKLLLQRHPAMQIVIPAANPACRQLIEQQLQANQLDDNASITLIDAQARTAMLASDVVLLASGTATLEALLAKRPMVIGYKIAPLTYTIVKRFGLLKVDRYALPNVLAQADIAPELMQADCTPEKIAAAVDDWLSHPEWVKPVIDRYTQIHNQLKRHASEQAALAIQDLLTP